MDKRVGKHLPSSGEVDKILKALDQAAKLASRFTCDLSAVERKHALRFRRGGEHVARLVADLAEQRHLNAGPGASVTDLRGGLDLVERLRPIVEAVEALSQRLADTVLEAQSECWRATTAYYTTLDRLSKVDGSLERSLEPAVDFFARKRRKPATLAAPPGHP